MFGQEKTKLQKDLDILEAMAEGSGPKETLVALGYAGWGTEQLEAEMVENSWLSCPASEEILFRTPYDQRWRASAKSIGVDMSTLSDITGHA